MQSEAGQLEAVGVSQWQTELSATIQPWCKLGVKQALSGSDDQDNKHLWQPTLAIVSLNSLQLGVASGNQRWSQRVHARAASHCCVCFLPAMQSCLSSLKFNGLSLQVRFPASVKLQQQRLNSGKIVDTGEIV